MPISQSEVRAYYSPCLEKTDGKQKRHFPADLLHQFLRAQVDVPLASRDLFFTCLSSSNKEFVSRFARIHNADEFIAYLHDHAAVRIDAGAVYPVGVAEYNDYRKQTRLAMKPLAKELVFDLDLSDYDNVRDCCRGKKVCDRCWAFVRVGMNILRELLRLFLGPDTRFLLVFSGRRGAHLWVNTGRSACMLEAERSLLLTKIREAAVDARTSYLSCYNMAAKALAQMRKSSAKAEGKTAEATARPEKRKRRGALPECVKYFWPRVDEPVTAQMSHLCKLPYSVHPGTGLIATPVHAEDWESWTPETFGISLSQLLELDGKISKLHKCAWKRSLKATREFVFD